MSAYSRPDLRRRHLIVALACSGFVAGMLGMAFAAVPLYRLFCSVTGFGGTVQRAEAAPAQILDRAIEVRFDANVAPGLPWQFRPLERTVAVRLGEQVKVGYEVVSRSRIATAGTATFNVTPPQAGAYFSKIDCFCFTEQVLEPGEKAEMPVVFFVDPAIARDPDLATLPSIVLSYTFFPVPGANESLVGDARRAAATRASDGI